MGNGFIYATNNEDFSELTIKITEGSYRDNATEQPGYGGIYVTTTNSDITTLL